MASVPGPSLSVDAAAQLAKADPGTSGNTEPGFANTYGPGASSAGSVLAAGLPALGVGGLGLLLLYRRHLQDQREKEKALAKQADLMDQLPGAHPKDMLLGAAVGGGAGLLYDLARGQPEGRRVSTTLKRLLTGAGIGAVGANIAGDRLRRYISNTKLPAGYGNESVLPRSWRQLYDAAIADKPSFDPKAVEAWNKKFPAGVGDAALSARRELIRRSFGVHRDNAHTDVWQRNKGDKGPSYFSLNEKNPAYAANLQKLYLPSALSPESVKSHKPPDNTVLAMIAGKSDEEIKALLKPLLLKERDRLEFLKSTGQPDASVMFASPHSLVPTINDPRSDLFGASTLLGGQQFVLGQPGEQGAIPGRVLDRFDITPSQQDTRQLWNDVTSLNVLNPSWYGKQRASSAEGYQPGDTNKSWLTSLLGRLFWDKMLVEEHPWVSQRLQFTPRQEGDYALQFQNEAGRPALPAMSSAQLAEHLSRLQQSSK